MLRRRPLYPTTLTPEEIIGDSGDSGLLESHFTLSVKYTDPERYEKAMQRKFTESERVHIATIYAKLREKGIWPKAIDKFGNIEFGVAVRSDFQDYVESLPLVERGEYENQEILL